MLDHIINIFIIMKSYDGNQSILDRKIDFGLPSLFKKWFLLYGELSLLTRDVGGQITRLINKC